MSKSRVRETQLLERCQFYQDVQIWPLSTKLNPSGWLDNFSPEDRPYAVCLLNAFLYFPAFFLDSLLASAVHNVAANEAPADLDYREKQSFFEEFFSTAYFSYVPGETPNPTDSGNLFMRKARQELGASEDKIKSPSEIIEHAVSNPGITVILLDDFVGSGAQCIKAWRTFNEPHTFERLAKERHLRMYYVPILSTQRGLAAIRERCPELCLLPGAILPENYNLLSNDATLWPPDQRINGQDMIRRRSLELGIPDTDGKDIHDWQGFNKLGLGLAFEHGVPDATVPIFYWEASGWTPLIRRT